MFLNYFALGVLIFVFLVIFYGIIILHDIPYLIAKKRNHPHSDAIHVAGWVSLFTLHVIWPFLWIWATLYQPARGWGMQHKQGLMALTASWRNSISVSLNSNIKSRICSRQRRHPQRRNNHGPVDHFDVRGHCVVGI